jgi:hypothetical protein
LSGAVQFPFDVQVDDEFDETPKQLVIEQSAPKYLSIH